MTTSPPMRLAVIGCGAITETFYAPALGARPPWLKSSVLVDPDPERRERLAGLVPDAHAAADHRAVLGDVDAAVVAVPAHLHHPIALDCIDAGVPLLIEKPLAETPAEAGDLVARAAAAGVAVGVNNTRRLYPANARARELVAAGAIGPLRRVWQEEGGPFAWPTVSGYYFQPGRRGVLFDRGAHVLDLVCWWLGDTPAATGCRTDSYGGPETVAAAEMALGEARAEVRLSWLTRLANRFMIEGEDGRLEGDVFDWRSLTVARGGTTTTERLKTDLLEFPDFAGVLLANLAAVAAGEEQPLVPAAEVAGSIRLIDDLYGLAERFEMPWMEPR